MKAVQHFPNFQPVGALHRDWSPFLGAGITGERLPAGARRRGCHGAALPGHLEAPHGGAETAGAGVTEGT